MVRKRRTPLPSGGESSESPESSGPSGHGSQHSTGDVVSHTHGGRGQGSAHPRQYQSQERGRSSQQGPRGEYRGSGESHGGARVPSSSAPPRHLIPELHQATESPQGRSIPSPLQYEASSSLATLPHHETARQLTQSPGLPEGGAGEVTQTGYSSSESMRFPPRPGRGSTGMRCIVKANHFFAELPDKDLHHYDVTIRPDVTSRVFNRKVMKNLVNQYRESHLGRRLPVYDGRKSLYTAGPLPFTSMEFKVIFVDDDDEDGSVGPRKEKEFKVTINLVARTDLHGLGLFLQGMQAGAPQEALQVLDIVLRELPTTRPRYCAVGRSFFSPDLGERQSLGEGLECWRGFYQSIRPTQMGLSLNIDMSSTAFIEALPIIEFVARLLNRDISSRPLSDSDRVKV